MLAVYADSINPDDPLARLQVGEGPEPEPPSGWTTVTVKAAALTHHDLWSLRGVGLSADALPMILGCDAAGLDEDGNEVVVHSVISSDSWRGDKPPELAFEHAACLPTAWLTAYRMLFTRGEVKPGMTVLVQGAGGGVATALI